MAGKSVRREVVLTPEFRVSFPYVFQPSKNLQDPTKPGKYSLTMLFTEKTDLTALKKAVADVMTQQFGPDKTKWPKIRMPFRDQSEKADRFQGYTPGAMFITATSKDRPGVVDAKVAPIIDPSAFYAGCYARATVNAYYYDQAGNKGVAFGLANVQKTRDGDSLGGRPSAESQFSAVDESGNGADAMADIFR